MCLRIYLNGDGTGRGTHLSLFFVVMRGPHDALLRWPFNQKVGADPVPVPGSGPQAPRVSEGSPFGGVHIPVDSAWAGGEPALGEAGWELHRHPGASSRELLGVPGDSQHLRPPPATATAQAGRPASAAGCCLS